MRTLKIYYVLAKSFLLPEPQHANSGAKVMCTNTPWALSLKTYFLVVILDSTSCYLMALTGHLLALAE